MSPAPNDPIGEHRRSRFADMVRDATERERTGGFTLEELVEHLKVALARAEEAEAALVLAHGQRDSAQDRADHAEALLQGLIRDPTSPDHLQANAKKVLSGVLALARERDTARARLAALRAAVLGFIGVDEETSLEQIMAGVAVCGVVSDEASAVEKLCEAVERSLDA